MKKFRHGDGNTGNSRMHDIAIQIVNYKTKQYLRECLRDIVRDVAGTAISRKILVLDNASGDDLSDLEREFSSQVSFHTADINRGFGAGHNILARLGLSRYILILNPDLKFIEEKTVSRLVEFLDKSAPNVAVVGPALVNDGGRQRWDHGEISGFRSWFSNKVGGSYWRARDDIAPAAWVSGAMFLIRREAFETLGGFDENFFLYKEEEDLCLGLRERGHRIVYNPTVKVFHYGSVVASKDKFFDASDRYFLEKHFRDRGWFIFRIVWALQRLKHRWLNRLLY